LVPLTSKISKFWLLPDNPHTIIHQLHIQSNIPAHKHKHKDSKDCMMPCKSQQVVTCKIMSDDAIYMNFKVPIKFCICIHMKNWIQKKLYKIKRRRGIEQRWWWWWEWMKGIKIKWIWHWNKELYKNDYGWWEFAFELWFICRWEIAGDWKLRYWINGKIEIFLRWNWIRGEFFMTCWVLSIFFGDMTDEIE